MYDLHALFERKIINVLVVGAQTPDKPVTRVKCKIKTCEFFTDNSKKFCFECEKYPCENLIHLDHRYKTKYHTSTIENLEHIKNSGINNFIDNEKLKWTCE